MEIKNKSFITVSNNKELKKAPANLEILPKNSNIPRPSSFNLDGARSPSPSKNREVTRTKKREKSAESEKKKTQTKKEKSKLKEEKKEIDIQTSIPVRDHKKNINVRGKSQERKKKNRDYQKFRSKFNTSAGNILKDWMSLIYCVLILRMNLIKLVLEQMPHSGSSAVHFQKQILMESKNIYDVIKRAQNCSQAQFLLLWKELEKLICNYMSLKNSLENKKQILVKIQDDLDNLELSQNSMLKSYTEKIEFLMNQIGEKEEELKEEQKEKKTIGTDLVKSVTNNSTVKKT